MPLEGSSITCCVDSLLFQIPTCRPTCILFWWIIETTWSLKRILHNSLDNWRFNEEQQRKYNTLFTIQYRSYFNNSLTVLLPTCEQSPLIYIYIYIYMRSSSKYSYCILTASKITIACISSSLWAIERICKTHRTFHRSHMATFARKQDCKQLRLMI